MGGVGGEARSEPEGEEGADDSGGEAVSVLFFGRRVGPSSVPLDRHCRIADKVLDACLPRRKGRLRKGRQREDTRAWDR